MKQPVRICGLGVRVPEETTLEALIALGDCRVVFAALEDARGLKWLKSRGVKARRPKGAAEVVAAARRGGPVGLAVWGHPQFDSALASEVEGLLRAEGLDFTVYGAISPVGSAFARSVSFLGGDYGYQGAHGAHLETLLSDPDSYSPRLPLIVYSERAAPARWEALLALLRARLPSGHEVRVYPAGSDGETRVALGRLAAKSLSGAVLLVPPAAGAPKRPHDVAG